MDILLGKITQQAMNYAIRSGITITSGFALQQCSRLIKSVKGSDKEEITALQRRLESKIRIVSPSIDMIELIAARGNTSLESAVTLTKQIRMDIQELGVRLSKAATDEELLRQKSSRAKSKEQMDLELQLIVADMKRLIGRIDDAVPLINLAISTSGVSLSTALPTTVSPSRLLQASTFLTAGDSNYVTSPGSAVQIGPPFVLSVYMLFAAHAYRSHDEDGVRETTWQEVIHKARVKLLRVPLEKLYDLPSALESAALPSKGAKPSSEEYFPTDVPSEGKAFEFAYQLLIIEDFDDDRLHEDEQLEVFEDVARAGIREVLPIHQISKIFYADTGKILNIGGDGETNNPILLLKRDVNAVPPRRMVERQTVPDDDYASAEEDDQDPPIAQNNGLATDPRGDTATLDPTETLRQEKPRKWRFPPNLDPEWMAFEVYTEAPDSEDEEETEISLEPSTPSAPTRPSPAPLSSAFSRLRLRNTPSTSPSASVEQLKSSQLVQPSPLNSPVQVMPQGTPSMPALRTSLSLLEVLIRLTALQQFQQSSHLAITDELLNFFLSESSTTGAGADSEYRRKTRRDARRRVGFDPYDESPIKRRGEEYLDQYGEQDQQQYNDGYDYGEDYRGPGAFDGEWRYGSGNGTPRSARNSPGLRSPDSVSSPSPSVRRAVQERAKSSPTINNTRQPVFRGPKGRPDVLRRGTGPRRSPLGRSESDSTLGTSPSEIKERQDQS